MRNSLFGHLPIVVFKANFYVKCVSNYRCNTLTVGKRYFVYEIGLNGGYKIKGDTNRYVWHKKNKFISKKV